MFLGIAVVEPGVRLVRGCLDDALPLLTDRDPVPLPLSGSFGLAAPVAAVGRRSSGPGPAVEAVALRAALGDSSGYRT